MPTLEMTLYEETCFECSRVMTQKYSTSFSAGIQTFDKQFRAPIYGIYGFVRSADEIVDTFYKQDQRQMIADFRAETFKAIEQGISLNPFLHSFQYMVNEYRISHELIDAFLRSMEMDLDYSAHTEETYSNYIFGSAEVIGLMCLKVFCGEDEQLYERLVPHARSLGSAFQKVNFLRDMKADIEDRGRTYFPNIDFRSFSEADKKYIEADIRMDFADGFAGIKQLPKGTKLGVYIAYRYFMQLFKKIIHMPANKVLQKRIRVSGAQKLSLYCTAVLQQKLNLI